MQDTASVIERVRKYLAGFLFAAGMPFAHLPGYIGGVLSLPSMFETRVWTTGAAVFIPLLGLAVFCGIRSLFLPVPVSGLLEIPDVFLSWILPFAAGLAIARKRDHLFLIYVSAWLILIVASVFAGLGVFPENFDLARELWKEGMMWALHHHNDFASSMVVIIPVILYKAITSRRMSWWVAAAIVMVGLVLSGSRGYYIAFIPAVTGFMVTELKRKRLCFLISISALVVFVLLILITPGIRSRVGQKIFADQSIVSRVNSLRVCGWILAQHPIVGLGPNQLVLHPEYLEKATSQGLFIDAGSGTMKHLHNVYATIAAEDGVIGLGFFLWMLLALGKKLRRGDGFSRALFWGYIGFLIGNLFDAQLMGPSSGMDFFFLAGLVIGPSGDRIFQGDH